MYVKLESSTFKWGWNPCILKCFLSMGGVSSIGRGFKNRVIHHQCQRWELFVFTFLFFSQSSFLAPFSCKEWKNEVSRNSTFWSRRASSSKCWWLLCSEKYTRSQYLEFISRKGCTLLEVFLCHESRPLIHCSERSKMILPNYCNVCILPFAGVVAKSSATTVHNISCPYHKNNYSIRYECAKYVTKSNECHHLRVCSSRIHRSRRPVSRLQPAKKLKIRI